MRLKPTLFHRYLAAIMATIFLWVNFVVVVAGFTKAHSLEETILTEVSHDTSGELNQTFVHSAPGKSYHTQLAFADIPIVAEEEKTELGKDFKTLSLLISYITNHAFPENAAAGLPQNDLNNFPTRNISIFLLDCVFRL